MTRIEHDRIEAHGHDGDPPLVPVHVQLAEQAGAGRGIAIGAAVMMIVFGVLIAITTTPHNGLSLIVAPALVLGGGAILIRMAYLDTHR